MPDPDTYRMSAMRATPFPNRLLELSLTLPETQAWVLAYVVRNTLGWAAGPPGERRASTAVSLRHLTRLVGRSTRIAVVEALAALAGSGVLEVADGAGRPVRFSLLRADARAGLVLRIARTWVVEA